MKFTIALIVALAVCATAMPISEEGQDVVGAKIMDEVTKGRTTVAIDVTNDFTDSVGDHKLEVLLDLTVASGVVSINQQPVAVNQVLALRIQANVSETIRATGAVVRLSPLMVTVQVGVQASLQIVQGVVVSTLTVQELIQEIDGTLLTQVAVRETIITLDESGNEASRVEGDAKNNFLAPSTPSQIQVGAQADASPSTSTTAPDASASDSDSDSSSSDSSSSDSSSSDSDSDGTGEDRSDEKQRVRRLARWLGKVLVVAALTFVSVMTIIVLLRCVRRVCCGVPETRVVSGSKLHYVPLAVDEVLDFKTTKETSVAI